MLFFYSITLFVNAALLFIIEPMVAKMILPFLGGSPAVWNTSLVFYQACLLMGYAYAHFGSRWLGTHRHALVHLILVLVGLLLLPVVLPVDWFDAPNHNPVGLVLGGLSVSIGLPFLVLSAGAPLMQKWFAQCEHGAADDPYFLYAASNAGSIAGLLAYPLILERQLTLSQQNHFWFFGYLLVVVLTSACVVYYLRPLWRHGENVVARDEESTSTPVDPRPVNFARRLRWVFWSLVPSSLLLGITSYVTTDVASAPLLWVLPLTAYLLSFVLAFARSEWTGSTFLARRQAFLLLRRRGYGFSTRNRSQMDHFAIAFDGFFCHRVGLSWTASSRPTERKARDGFLFLDIAGRRLGRNSQCVDRTAHLYGCSRISTGHCCRSIHPSVHWQQE